jgi:hypothetical protein
MRATSTKTSLNCTPRCTVGPLSDTCEVRLMPSCSVPGDDCGVPHVGPDEGRTRDDAIRSPDASRQARPGHLDSTTRGQLRLPNRFPIRSDCRRRRSTSPHALYQPAQSKRKGWASLGRQPYAIWTHVHSGSHPGEAGHLQEDLGRGLGTC